jgi:hypothetical protein
MKVRHVSESAVQSNLEDPRSSQPQSRRGASATEIVDMGAHGNGMPKRWRFTEIMPDWFRGTREVLAEDGRAGKASS